MALTIDGSDPSGDLGDLLAAKVDYALPVNTQTGTTYTFVLADGLRLTTANNAAASTFTVPPQSSVVWLANSIIRLVNLGAGAVTIDGGSGVTVTNTAATVAQFQSVDCIRTGSDAWTVVVAGGGDEPGLVFLASAALTGSSVNVQSVFSASFDSYKLVIDLVNSATSQVSLRLLLGSTPNTDNSYTRQLFEAFGTTTEAATATQTSARMILGATTGSIHIIDLINPFLALPTFMSGTGGSGNNIFHAVVKHDVSTSFDGFQIFPGSGTMTSGTVKVYGYKTS